MMFDYMKWRMVEFSVAVKGNCGEVGLLADVREEQKGWKWCQIKHYHTDSIHGLWLVSGKPELATNLIYERWISRTRQSVLGCIAAFSSSFALFHSKRDRKSAISGRLTVADDQKYHEPCCSPRLQFSSCSSNVTWLLCCTICRITLLNKSTECCQVKQIVIGFVPIAS